MLRRDGIVNVVDLGLAKPSARPSTDSEALTAVNTAAGIFIGTARYMSPERARGLELDPRTDIFSLGGVIYEMLGGRAPFEGETLSDVSVTKALAKDRAQRYRSIEDLTLDLKSLRQDVKFQTRLADIKKAESSGQIDPVLTRSTRRAVGREQERAACMLSEIYGWFTEEFDTADLRAADELLTALA